MRYRILFILSVYLLGIDASIGEEKGLPFELLGQEWKEIRPQLIAYSDDGDFLDEIYNGKWDSRVVIIDKDRCYLTLNTADSTISAIYIQDSCYSTGENIRVGDSFSQVRSAYPDAKFRAGQEGVVAGVYDLVIKDGKIAFWFDAHAIRQRISEGERIEMDHAMVQKMKLSLIHIRGPRDIGTGTKGGTAKGRSSLTDADRLGSFWDPHTYYGGIDVMINGLNSEQAADALYKSGHFNRVSSFTDGRTSAHADNNIFGHQGRFIDWIWQGY